jgi:hypothetical protein
MTQTTDPWGDIALTATKDWTTLIPLVFALVVLALVVLVILAAVAVALRYVLRGKTLKAGPLALGDGTEGDRPPAVESRIEALEGAHQELLKVVTPLTGIPDQVATIHERQSQELDFRRTMLVVTAHQTSALKVLLQVTQGTKINGNVDGAIRRMDEAQRTTEDYLVKTATGGR